MNSTENRNALCRLKRGAGGKHSHQLKRAFNILFRARRGKKLLGTSGHVVDNSLWTVNFYCDYSLKRVIEILKIGELTLTQLRHRIHTKLL